MGYSEKLNNLMISKQAGKREDARNGLFLLDLIGGDIYNPQTLAHGQ